MANVLTFDELKTIALTDFGLTERQWKKAQFSFLEITGKHRASAYDITPSCLSEVYDQIAEDLVKAVSELAVVENVLRIVLFLLTIHFGSSVNLYRCENLLKDRTRFWDGKVGRMRLEAEEKAEDYQPKPAAPPTTPRPSNTVPRSVAGELEALRLRADITQETLAELVKLETRTVQRHLAGDTVPSARILFRYQKQFSKLLNEQIVISKLS